MYTYRRGRGGRARKYRELKERSIIPMLTVVLLVAQLRQSRCGYVYTKNIGSVDAGQEKVFFLIGVRVECGRGVILQCSFAQYVFQKNVMKQKRVDTSV